MLKTDGKYHVKADLILEVQPLPTSFLFLFLHIKSMFYTFEITKTGFYRKNLLKVVEEPKRPLNFNIDYKGPSATFFYFLSSSTAIHIVIIFAQALARLIQPQSFRLFIFFPEAEYFVLK